MNNSGYITQMYKNQVLFLKVKMKQIQKGTWYPII